MSNYIPFFPTTIPGSESGTFPCMLDGVLGKKMNWINITALKEEIHKIEKKMGELRAENAELRKQMRPKRKYR